MKNKIKIENWKKNGFYEIIKGRIENEFQKKI